jgi:hypothetical protein
MDYMGEGKAKSITQMGKLSCVGSLPKLIGLKSNMTIVQLNRHVPPQRDNK